MKFGSITTGIVSDGLVFNMDAANRASYIPNATTVYNTFLPTTSSGSLENGTTYDSSNGGSFYFGGGDEYIDCSTDILAHVSNVSTLSIGQWVKPYINDFLSSGYQDSHPASRMNLGTWNNNNVIFNIGETGGATGCHMYKSYAGGWGSWSYLVCTYDKSQGSHATRQRGYINGVDPGGWTLGGNSGNNTGTLTKWYLGYMGAWSSYGLGNIANFHVYNRAISAEEVLHNYNALKGRFT